MRMLKYRLTNGTVVDTFKEAQTSGQGYSAIMVEVEKAEVTLTEKQRAKRVKI